MVRITFDHSAMIFYDRHPVIGELKKLEDDGKVRIYHAQNLNRDLGSFSKMEEKMYERLRHIIFDKKQQDLTLTEHGDLSLLINHMKTKRDFFLTLEKGKYKSLEKHHGLKIRFPDEDFLDEVKEGIEARDKIEKRKARESARIVKAKRRPSRRVKKSRKKR
jgi:hypothetical protein